MFMGKVYEVQGVIDDDGTVRAMGIETGLLSDGDILKISDEANGRFINWIVHVDDDFAITLEFKFCNFASYFQFIDNQLKRIEYDDQDLP